MKALAYKKEIFDINKIEVVGSPTITEDGVASGFSANDYINTIPLSMLKNKSWEIETVFQANNNNLPTALFCISDTINFGGVGYSFAYNRFQFGGRFGGNNDEVGVAISLFTTLTEGEFYKVKLEFNYLTGLYTLSYGFANGEYITSGSYTPVTENKQITDIVNDRNTSVVLTSKIGWNGVFPIDLKEFKIYVDGNLVYSPTKLQPMLEHRKEGFDINKFEVVGSPTITDDGIASGFGTASLVRTSYNKFTNSVKHTMHSRFTIKKGSYPQVFYCWTISNTSNMRLDFNTAFTIIHFRDVNDTEYTLGDMTEVLSDNDVIDITVTIYKSNISLVITKEGKQIFNKNADCVVDFEEGNVCMGAWGTTYGWQGSIDLKQFSITVDNQEVFNGQKDKYYILRR